MSTVDNELSEAVVLCTGWGRTPAPHVDPSKVIDRFGVARGESLLEMIKAIFRSLDATQIDWSQHTLVSAGRLARDQVQEKFTGLSEDALKALEWKFTFDYR